MGKWSNREFDRVLADKIRQLYDTCNDRDLCHGCDIRFHTFIRNLNPEDKAVQACFRSLLQQVRYSTSAHPARPTPFDGYQTYAPHGDVDSPISDATILAWPRPEEGEGEHSVFEGIGPGPVPDLGMGAGEEPGIDFRLGLRAHRSLSLTPGPSAFIDYRPGDVFRDVGSDRPGRSGLREDHPSVGALRPRSTSASVPDSLSGARRRARPRDLSPFANPVARASPPHSPSRVWLEEHAQAANYGPGVESNSFRLLHELDGANDTIAAGNPRRRRRTDNEGGDLWAPAATRRRMNGGGDAWEEGDLGWRRGFQSPPPDRAYSPAYRAEIPTYRAGPPSHRAASVPYRAASPTYGAYSPVHEWQEPSTRTAGRLTRSARMERDNRDRRRDGVVFAPSFGVRDLSPSRPANAHPVQVADSLLHPGRNGISQEPPSQAFRWGLTRARSIPDFPQTAAFAQV